MSVFDALDTGRERLSDRTRRIRVHGHISAPIVGGLSRGTNLRFGVLGRFNRIIDDPHPATAAGQRAADRGGQTRAPLCRLEFFGAVLPARSSSTDLPRCFIKSVSVSASSRRARTPNCQNAKPTSGFDNGTPGDLFPNGRGATRNCGGVGATPNSRGPRHSRGADLASARREAEAGHG
jgi:hypothetical protein